MEQTAEDRLAQSASRTGLLRQWNGSSDTVDRMLAGGPHQGMAREMTEGKFPDLLKHQSSA